jgi:hypothetical protein
MMNYFSIHNQLRKSYRLRIMRGTRGFADRPILSGMRQMAIGRTALNDERAELSPRSAEVVATYMKQKEEIYSLHESLDKEIINILQFGADKSPSSPEVIVAENSSSRHSLDINRANSQQDYNHVQSLDTMEPFYDRVIKRLNDVDSSLGQIELDLNKSRSISSSGSTEGTDEMLKTLNCYKGEMLKLSEYVPLEVPIDVSYYLSGTNALIGILEAIK